MDVDELLGDLFGTLKTGKLDDRIDPMDLAMILSGYDNYKFDIIEAAWAGDKSADFYLGMLAACKAFVGYHKEMGINTLIPGDDTGLGFDYIFAGQIALMWRRGEIKKAAQGCFPMAPKEEAFAILKVLCEKIDAFMGNRDLRTPVLANILAIMMVNYAMDAVGDDPQKKAYYEKVNLAIQNLKK